MVLRAIMSIRERKSTREPHPDNVYRLTAPASQSGAGWSGLPDLQWHVLFRVPTAGTYMALVPAV